MEFGVISAFKSRFCYLLAVQKLIFLSAILVSAHSSYFKELLGGLNVAEKQSALHTAFHKTSAECDPFLPLRTLSCIAIFPISDFWFLFVFLPLYSEAFHYFFLQAYLSDLLESRIKSPFKAGDM